ncbi:MAG TPA: hypothetical protein VG742_21070, partial [Dongiaceae bacterium]|nr:hypothetical protein [Dongiaceae bacterium]
MTSPALIALLDTLLPGDAPLPPFSQAGVDPSQFAEAARPILGAIDGMAFQTNAAAEVQRIAQVLPDEFRILLSQALAGYYQAASVQAALGWRSDPPQP